MYTHLFIPEFFQTHGTRLCVVKASIVSVATVTFGFHGWKSLVGNFSNGLLRNKNKYQTINMTKYVKNAN